MASGNFILVVAAILAVFLPAATMAATEHWVGGKSGWTINYDYPAWANERVFYVGDSLVFSYTKGHHNVYVANQTEFKDCIVPTGKKPFTSGHDTITLATPGKKWYICGIPTHCSEHKQKLAITVVEGGAPVPAPAPAPAPVPVPVLTPPATNTPVTQPDSPTSSAYGILKSKYQVLTVAAVALAIILIA
ncbi:hypothetical protein ACH5RR_004432 [Cinchona calisaya]|uniref:Phytocyanin domain-containing protein n=1 Tax=Cinchona calisaya TaxID=153742 RepID=A0ABD3AY05_9GENT